MDWVDFIFPVINMVCINRYPFSSGSGGWIAFAVELILLMIVDSLEQCKLVGVFLAPSLLK